jgi:hypothetical protein
MDHLNLDIALTLSAKFFLPARIAGTRGRF